MAFTTADSGEIAGNVVVEQMPDKPCAMVMFRAVSSNAGNVYIGGPGSTKPDGTDDFTAGFELAPGEMTAWIPIDNLNRLYFICDNATDDINFFLVV